MNTKNLVLMALLIGIGTALYVVIPGFVQGMKPDFILTMMFIGILLFPTVKETFLLGLSAGVLSGLFTTFPAGFLPNVVDKFVTAFVFLAIVLVLKKLTTNMVLTTISVGIGTLISGVIFLSVALFAMGTDVGAPFLILFSSVVLPAVAFNAGAFIVIYPIIQKLVKRSNFKTSLSHT
ncbi:MAG: tryptophan transporter [Solibacillus sp.]